MNEIESLAATTGVHPSVILRAAEWCADFLEREGGVESFINDTPDRQAYLGGALLQDYCRVMKAKGIKALSSPAAMDALQDYVYAALTQEESA